jgi:hypothetical protein
LEGWKIGGVSQASQFTTLPFFHSSNLPAFQYEKLTMLYRTWTLVLKELIQLFRSPFLVILVTLGPLTEMSMVAWSTAAPIEHLPTAVADLDRSRESRELLYALYNTETFDFRYYLDSKQPLGRDASS